MKSELQIRYNVLVNHNFEKIADDYAIEFVEFIANKGYDLNYWEDKESINQLLETFKNEKGL